MHQLEFSYSLPCIYMCICLNTYINVFNNIIGTFSYISLFKIKLSFRSTII